MASGTRPTTSSSSTASNSTFSLPGSLGNVLSWTFSRWNSHGSATSQENCSFHPTGQSSHYSAAGSTLSLTPSEMESMASSRYKTCESSLADSRPPSRHRASPWAPPPLPPIALTGYSSHTRSHLLTRSLAEEIRQLIPARLQLYECWSLVYSLEQHGVSLHTLYERCGLREFKQGGFVLAVKDDNGGIFGAFVNEAFRPSGRYYGTRECFLWKACWLPVKDGSGFEEAGSTKSGNKLADSGLLIPELQERPSTPASFRSTKTTSSRAGDRLRFKAFPYSGVNDYMIYCDQAFLSTGGGDGKYGLWLDDNLEKGVSSACPTFGNEPLSEEGEKFDIIGVEVWCIGAANSL